MLRKRCLIVVLPLWLTACGAAKPVWAPEAAVERARYVHDGPPAITLFTMVSNDTGSGGHSSLMINASQRVIFDPAGTVTHESIPERNDVLFGVSPGVADFYTRAHARKSWHVVIQRKEVPAAVAERALRDALAYGAVSRAHCAIATSAILRDLPGFESVGGTWFPVSLSADFARLPGVETRELYEYDDDDKRVALRAYDPAAVAAQEGG